MRAGHCFFAEQPAHYKANESCEVQRAPMSQGSSPVSRSSQSHEASPSPPVELKNPLLAGFLAWLLPGLGHLYQGRIAKGVLFFACLMSTYAYGCYLGGSRQTGWARVVYLAWHEDDKRLYFLCQVGMGLPSLPAVIQASRVRNGKTPLWNGFMAPPRIGPPREDAPSDLSLDELHRRLHMYFELGTLYTAIAGLLNVLAIYDAWAGPVTPEDEKPEGTKDQDSPDQREKAS